MQMEETAPSAAHLGRADYFAVETLLAMSRHGKDSVVRPLPGMDLTPPNSEDEQEEASPGKGGCSRSSELARVRRTFPAFYLFFILPPIRQMAFCLR